MRSPARVPEGEAADRYAELSALLAVLEGESGLSFGALMAGEGRLARLYRRSFWEGVFLCEDPRILLLNWRARG